jgi:translocation and assembly module TamB
MWRRLLSILILSLLSLSLAYADLAINADSSLETFNYDLEGIHLKLEKLNARWQLSPFGDGQLLVEKIDAKKLIITVNHGTKKQDNSGLPERIKLPFPITIKQATVAELVVIDGDTKRTFNNVKFALEADTKTIKLNTLNAQTPWGEAAITLQMDTAKPFALTGEAAIKQTAHSTPYDIKAKLSGDLNTLRMQSTLLLTTIDGKLAITQEAAMNTTHAARITIDGQLILSGDYALSLQAHLTDLNPEQLGNYPSATLNVSSNITGKLLPEPHLAVQYATHDSHWHNQPFTSAGTLQMNGNSLNNIEIKANLADNSLNATGDFSLNSNENTAASNRINWQANLADLSRLGADYQGWLRADGTLEGSLENLALKATVEAQKLRLQGGLKIEQLIGQANIMPEADGKVSADFKASGLQYGTHPLLDAGLILQGSKLQHQLAVNAQGKEFKLTSHLQGGLNKTLWQGQLQDLTLEGATPLKLTESAPLRFDIASENTSLLLEKATIQLASGRIRIDQLGFDARGFNSTGHIEKIALRDIPANFLPLPTGLQGDATFAGQWNIKATTTLNGNLNLRREAGDLSMLSAGGVVKPLGLENVTTDINIIDNNASLHLAISGKGIGNLQTDVATTLTKIDAGYAILANAPLNLKGSAQLDSLAWLPLPLSLMDAKVDGEIKLDVAGNGTVGAPNLNGRLQAKNLLFSLPREGLTLQDGTLDANFEKDSLLINQASWRGGDGTIKTSGLMHIEKGKPTVNLDWTADQFTVISRADRLLVLSGTGNTTLIDDLLTISGNFSVDKGLAELANEDTPTLGDDVVILGKTDIKPEPALKLLLNGLSINLGDNFRLRGRGLDAELTGALTFTGLTQYHPHTEGSIQTKSGTYMAYGQVLTIERGLLNFNGTVDNPGLSIRAMRNSKPTNAGVEITGSLQNPATKLVSDPEVADSEKLSWLVLGHGMDQTTKNDYGVLSLAAGIILSQGQSVPLQTQIAHAAGLDELSFSGGDASSASVVFGKRLTSQLYLSYVKSISGLLDVARITFNITPEWSVRGEAGTESAVDMLYSFSFK